MNVAVSLCDSYTCAISHLWSGPVRGLDSCRAGHQAGGRLHGGSQVNQSIPERIHLLLLGKKKKERQGVSQRLLLIMKVAIGAAASQSD